MIEEFERLGLSFYEAKALEALFKENLTARELCKRTGIPPGKIYSVVLSLEQKGLVHKTETRPQKIFVNNASDVVGSLIEKKQNEHEQLLNKVKSFATLVDSSKARTSKFFDIATTPDEIKRLQLRSFMEAQKEVCQILNVHHDPKSNRPNKLAYEREIVKAANRGVRFRSIYSIQAKLPALLERLNKTTQSFVVKRFDTDFPRCDIIDGRKVLIKLVGHDAAIMGGALFIENDRLASHLQEIFEDMWESATG